MSVEFFQTRMRRQYYEGAMPELVRQLARLNELLERLLAGTPSFGEGRCWQLEARPSVLRMA
jgi:hypothetical protein